MVGIVGVIGIVGVVPVGVLGVLDEDANRQLPWPGSPTRPRIEFPHCKNKSSSRMIVCLTWISTSKLCSSSENAAGGNWVLLVVVVEGIRGVIMNRVWFVASSTRLDS